MAFVYVIADAREDGPETAAATLERSRLFDLVELTYRHIEGTWRPDAIIALAALLEKTDEELAIEPKWDCHIGWGGMYLQVLELK
jgi:hypothetical protein